MALFPSRNGGDYSEEDRYIQSRMEESYRNGNTQTQAFWGEADIDTRFEAGDQQVFSDIYGNVPFSRRKTFSYNRIRPGVNMVSGQQRRNRKSTIVTPIENGDQETADQFTKIMSWCNQQEGILHTVSDAFHGALVTGLNLLQVWVDYRRDPVSGDIKVDNCNYNSFMIDPYFRKKDLSDCKYLWKRSLLSKTEVMSLLPDHKDVIETLDGKYNKDGKFQFLPENYDLNHRDFLSYDEYYYRDYRSQRMLVDTQTGETMEWSSKDEDALRQFTQEYPQVTIIDQDIPTVKLAIVVEGHVFFNDLNPMGTDRYPFVPVFGYYNPQIPDFSLRLQGIVRSMRDPQYLFNRTKTQISDIFESRLNSGYVAKEDSVINPRDLLMAGQGQTIFLKKEAQMTDVQPIQTQDIPQGIFQIEKNYGDEIIKTTGINEENLGSASDEMAGVLSMLRQGAGLTTLQPLFDNLDQSQKLLGQLMIDIIQSNFTPGKVKRIIEGEPSQQFYNKAFGKYDAAVEEGLNTTTQRQMQFAQLLQLKEAGVPVPDDVIIEAATIQNKEKLSESIRQSNEQQQKAEEMQQQVTMRELESRTNYADAKADNERAGSIEKIARSEEERQQAIENVATAERERTQSMLNLAKTLQEMDDIDIQQIEKLLTIAQMVKVAAPQPAAPVKPPVQSQGV